MVLDGGGPDVQSTLTVPVVQFRTSSSVHTIALNPTGDTLAVGTSDQTEIYRVHAP